MELPDILIFMCQCLPAMAIGCWMLRKTGCQQPILCHQPFFLTSNFLGCAALFVFLLRVLPCEPRQILPLVVLLSPLPMFGKILNDDEISLIQKDGKNKRIPQTAHG
jgi:hypothetical protein